MSGYQRINFKDQNVERPKTYDVTNNPDGSITLIESFGNVEELGTPINQENMNHIEDGIDAVSFSKFSLDSTYKKDDLVTDIQDDELKIFKSLKDNNFGHLLSEGEYWEEVEIAGGKGSGFNLGDMIITDHILEGDDAKGKALQGTFVTKALYPDFYNKWHNYFKTANQKTWLKSNITKVGSLNDNQGVLSGFSASNYAIIEDIPSTLSTFEIVFNITIGDASGYNSVCGQVTGNLTCPQIAPSNALENGFNFGISQDGNTWTAVNMLPAELVSNGEQYWLKAIWDGSALRGYYSIDGLNWVESAIKDSVSNVVWTAQLAIGIDYDANNNNKYFKGSIDLKESYININGERWWTGANSIAKNPNGLMFYNIAEKPLIDAIYNQYGIADYYGIDEENERIFLPRNKYFHQLTDDPSKVNEMVEAGLPNHKHYEFGTSGGATADFDPPSNHLSATAQVRSSGSGGYGRYVLASDSAQATVGLSSNPIDQTVYGNSDTVQPPASLKLLYYCVGNTVVNEAQIDAGGLVAQVEQKANTTLDNVTPCQEFKSQSISWGMPSDNYIDLILGANGTDYTAPANGYFYLAKAADSWQTVGLIRRSNTPTWTDLTSYQTAYGGSGNVLPVWLPVKKGDVVGVSYNATGATQAFRFFYAEGEQ